MRNRFSEVFYELAKKDDSLNIVVADISPAGSIAKFREEFPQRFINTGVAEQIMIGMVAGMAQKGLRPFAYTIATFALFRPFEFIRDDLCYQNLPVTIVGIGGGVSYSTLGGTHHAMEDISIACSLPNMSVIAPCDPQETEEATRWCASQNIGPVYMRLGRAGEPVITDQSSEKWQFGKLRALKNDGQDIAIISYGTIMNMALELAENIEKAGSKVSIFSCHTLKPLDVSSLESVVKKFSRVIVLEEAIPTGSLGSRVKEIAWDMKSQCEINTFCLQDAFIHCYGTHNDILAAHGLSVPKIMQKINASKKSIIENNEATSEHTLKLYGEMLRIRRIEEAIALRYPEAEMRCPTHFCTGQEAVPVGIMSHLSASDLIFSGHRSHGHFLAKGGSLNSMMAELYGRQDGCAQGRGGSQHLIDLEAGFVASAPILAGTIPIAVGAAWSIKELQQNRIVVVFFGDGATEEGVFYESLNYATLHSLPIVFVCENNLYSVHSKMNVRQSEKRTIACIAKGHGIPSSTIDGNDVNCVSAAGFEAIERVRTGNGPVLLECLTYRWLEHCGPSDDIVLGYRSKDELDEWKLKCPIKKAEKILKKAHAISDKTISNLEKQIAVEIDEAFSFAKGSPFPDESNFSIFTYPDGEQ